MKEEIKNIFEVLRIIGGAMFGMKTTTDINLAVANAHAAAESHMMKKYDSPTVKDMEREFLSNWTISFISHNYKTVTLVMSDVFAFAAEDSRYANFCESLYSPKPSNQKLIDIVFSEAIQRMCAYYYKDWKKCHRVT